MENAYGIGVTNRYQLFLDNEEDPLEVLKVQEQEKEAKKKTKLSEKENKGKVEPKGKPVPAARKTIKETQNLKSQDQQKSKEDLVKSKTTPRMNSDRLDRIPKYSNENREERNNKRNREDKPFVASEYHREDRPEGRFERREVRGGGNADGREFRGGIGGTGAGEGGENRGRNRGISGRGGLGRGRGRGSRGGYDGRGKREFDRQSGSDKTGIKPVDKRDGGGAHNWGSHRDDIEEMNNANRQTTDDSVEWVTEKVDTDPITPDTADSKDTGNVPNGHEQDEPPAPVEEERKELTLDEWKALRGTRQKPTYNIRKAGEGEDPSQWKKMYALQKRKEGEEEDEDDEEYESSEYPQRVGRQKHVLEIDIHFADTRVGGRGRGARGGGRGGPRGGAKGVSSTTTSAAAAAASAAATAVATTTTAATTTTTTERGLSTVRDRDRETSYQVTRGGRQSAPKVDDEHDFPSLG